MVKKRRGTLAKKLLRDVRRNFMQFFAMAMLCALGTWVFAGLDASWRMQDATIETYLSAQRLSDFWVHSASFSRQDLTRIRHAEGVEEVVGRVTLNMDAPELGDQVTVTAHAFDGTMTLNTPVIRLGDTLKTNDTRGCLVEEQFAQAQGISPGDTLTLRYGGQDWTFRVRGTVLSPEYLFTTKDMAPDPSTYGFVLLNREAMADFPINELLIGLKDGADPASAEAEISACVPEALIVTQRTHGSTIQARSYVSLFQSMSYLFPALAYFVAALVVVTTISRMMNQERVQMGALKALGYTDRQIRRIYIHYAFWPALIGSALGLGVAQFTIPQIIFRMIATNMRVPEVIQAPISPLSWGMAAAEVAAAALVCFLHISRAARESTADLLRPKPPKAGERVLLERVAFLWRRFSFNRKMIVRNVLRSKGRTIMSMVGMLFCNMLIICSFGLQESIPYFVGEYFNGTLRYDMRVELDASMAGTLSSYRGRLQAERVDGLMDRSVSLRTKDVTRVSQLTVVPDDTELLRLGPNGEKLQLSDEGVVLTEKLASLLKAEVGDEIELWFTGDDVPERLTVVQLVKSNIGQSAYVSETAWDKLRRGAFRPTALLIRGASQEAVDRIDQMDEMVTITYPSSQYDQTMRIMDSAAGAFSLLSGVALGLAFVICYNMGLLNFTERTREYATLKVLGYHQKEIRGLMLRENNLTAVFGVAAGIVPGILLVGVILKMCEFDSMVFVPHITWLIVLLSSLATFAFTWLIEGLLTRKVRAIDMVEALKSVE
ncbi:MAG: ABC transporter permease [Clostridia bacterium]|nr:ABC transporter permease [Clostridia bacterium]